MVKRKYDDEFKKRLIKLHIEDGRSMESKKKNIIYLMESLINGLKTIVKKALQIKL